MTDAPLEDILTDLNPTEEGLYTRRQYMVHKLKQQGVITSQAVEVVSLVEAQHPGWDMDTRHTWPEWESIRIQGEAQRGRVR